MRSILYFFTLTGLLLAKDIHYKSQDQEPKVLMSSQGAIQNHIEPHTPVRSSRDDTSTVWFEDFEGDIDGWEFDAEWELTETSSFSPTHSFNFPNTTYNLTSNLVSPVITVPELEAENQIFKLNFALLCDLPDFDGTGDNSLEDYYSVSIANLSETSTFFHTTSSDAYENQSWWCADPGVGGYLDAWLQVLQSPTISVPMMGPTLSAMMKWGIEDPAGASVGGTCTDGWDAANVRISNDDGATWNLLTGDDAYDFNYGYGWIYNDEAYDCDGALEQVAAGWGGQADWHEVTFDLGDYAGDDVIIQFVFGSDPGYATPDDNTLTGFMVDNITVTEGNGDVVFFDNGDDETSMIAMNGLDAQWDQYFYDYGDISRPGGLGWEVYQPGMAFNGNSALDISAYAGSDIKIRFTGRLDGDDDGGTGDGLFIDDVHMWKVEFNNVPMVEDLEVTALDGQVALTWDMPPGGSYTDTPISFNDNSFEDALWMQTGTSVMGEMFDMPYGIESAIVNSAAVWGEEGDAATGAPAGGASTLYGYDMVAGTPMPTATYSQSITLNPGQWNELDLGWTFSGDFVLALEISPDVAISIDSDGAPGQHSWANLGGWEPWTDAAAYYGLTDGEFGINANVTTVGGTEEPEFHVYRNPGMGEDGWQIMFQTNDNYTDNFFNDYSVVNGTEYCYQVTSVYGSDESEPAGPICVVPEAQTIYEIAYDDGSAETSTNVSIQNYLAVKFTPIGYPADLYRASFYTSGANTNGVTIVKVWDDDGDNGMPGTELISNVPITFTGDVWTDVSLSGYNITIDDGSFYIGWQELDPVLIGVDTDNPATNSYVDIGAGWENFVNYFDAALMVRAELDSVNVMGLNDLSDNLPKSFGLNQNYPNPFNPVTTITFDIAENAFTSLRVYDLTGREVLTLLERNLNPGNYSYGLNASDMPSGMYFYRLVALDSDGKSTFTSTKKLLLMK